MVFDEFLKLKVNFQGSVIVMINLKTKADENYDAFVLLKDNGKLNSSIHCAYYSAFLLSIYSLCVRFGYLYEDIQNNSRGLYQE